MRIIFGGFELDLSPARGYLFFRVARWEAYWGTGEGWTLSRAR